MPRDDSILRYSGAKSKNAVNRPRNRQSDRPLLPDELVAELEPREPIGEPKDAVIEFDLSVAAGRDLDIAVEQEIHEGAYLSGRDRSELGRATPWHVRLAIRNAALGVHVYPPRAEIVEVESDHDEHSHAEFAEFDGFLPDHLPLRLTPRKLPEELRVPRRILAPGTVDRANRDRPYFATTIFGPDNRYIFNDTSYPWCTVGRVDTPGGTGSGTMVGPRHLLTCSHAIQWNADNTAGWVKFTPSYFDGSAPFGVAWGIRLYWEGTKVYGPTVDRDEGQHDYVCVVLDRTIGNLTGWMGARSWSDDWDDLGVWRHIGYPGDLAGAQRPSYQAGIALDGSFWDREVHTRIFHHADVWPGQSGGPFFAWWSGESFPRVVADQSGQNSDENTASGGAHMVGCIIRARNDYP
jgi:V8-like Glu-specific endopeptidase